MSETISNCNNTNENEMSIEIEEPLQDVIADACSDTILECMISGDSEIRVVWLRNGYAIVPSRRIKMFSNKKWYRLEIKSVTEKDHGVYTLVCDNGTCVTHLTANLYIRNTRESIHNDNAIYMYPCPKQSLSVAERLVNTIVKTGEKIHLKVQIQSEKSEEFKWFKNNQLIESKDRIVLHHKISISELIIDNAEIGDSGLYIVVTRTKYGFVSSFANVLVLEADSKTNDSDYAVIEEYLPDELEANETEDIRLICKTKCHQHTKIRWLKNNKVIENCDRFKLEYYGDQYVGLRITEPCKTDTAKYTIILSNELTAETDASSCYLTVKPCPMNNLSIVQLRKPLESVTASVGSKIAFDCSFDLEDSRYYFVVWYVGHYRIERTNTQFNVISKRGNFILYIKKIEPGMAGEVVCELRKSVPNVRSVLVNSATTYLTIVPLNVIREERNANPNLIERIYREMPDPRNGDANHTVNGYIKQSTNGCNGNKYKPNDVILAILYCRLEDDNNCFLRAAGDEDFIKKSHTQLLTYTKTQKEKIVVIEWEAIDSSVWYGIDIEQPDGEFVRAGVTSRPMFEICNAPIEKLMKFRIRAVTPLDDASDCNICIVPAPEKIKKTQKTYELKCMEQFEPTFTKTGDLLGCGAFGSVVLVHDKSGEYYAAKVLKTRTQKKRDTAMREYEMMKELMHPKLVELHDAFAAKDSFIIVMDYLWGGELFDRVVEEEHIKEIDVVPYVRQICEALEFLHANKIAHLDLKPENIICLSPNSRQVKIIDFGLARVLDEGNVTRAIYGTRDYIAPEVLNFERLTLFCDMWSLGVVTYMLLSGVMPFGGDSWPERSANITMANYNYDEIAFKDISDLAKDFVDKLLVVTADKRMSATSALNHLWIKQGPPKGAKAGPMKKARENLKSYLANYRARWQRAGNVMIAAHRLRNHLLGLRSVQTNLSMSPKVT